MTVKRLVTAVLTLALAISSSFLSASVAFSAITDDCSALTVQDGLKVTPNHAKIFYIDSGQGQSVDAGYASYTVTNSSSTARQNLWVQLSNFSGGVVSLANSADSSMPLPTLVANSGAGTTYFLLKAAGSSGSRQAHSVKVFSGKPGLAGSTPLYECTYGFTKVAETIKASANKVTSMVQPTTSTLALGGKFIVNVEGITGTVGSGNSVDGSLLWFSAAARSSWPTQALRLEKVSVAFSNQGGGKAYGTIADDISVSLADLQALPGASGAKAFTYVATYTFAVVGPTASAVKPSPIAQIASGTQTKHTDMGGVDSAATSAFSSGLNVSTALSFAVTKSVASTIGSDGSNSVLNYSVKLINTGSTSVTVDQVVDSPSTGLSYVPQSVRLAGSSTNEPALNSSGQLVFTGPITVPTGVTGVTLSYGMSFPSCTSGTFSYSNSVVAQIGEVSFGSTATKIQEITASGTCGNTAVASTSTEIALPPEAVTAPASSVTTSSGTINGTVDSNGTSGLAIYFEWGESATLANANRIDLGSSTTATGPVAQSRNLTNLSSGRIYYFRVGIGEVRGQILSFVTPEVAALPTATTLNPTNLAVATDARGAVLGVSATLSGSIDPNQVASGVKVKFVWAQDSSALGNCSTLGSQTTVPSSGFLKDETAEISLSGSFPTDVALDVPDNINTTVYFTSGQRYCYKIVGYYDVGGTTWTTDVDGGWIPFLAKSRSAQTISFPVPIITGTSGTAAATASSGLTVTYTSQTPDVCSVDADRTITVLSSGVCTLLASQSGNDSFEPALDVAVSVTVTGPPRITTMALPSGQYGTPYSYSLDAADGSGSYVSYRIVSGTLPAGLSFSSNGTISGTPTATAVGAVLEFSVTDSADSASGAKSLTITITPAPLVVTASSHSVTYGDPQPSLTPLYEGFVNGDDERDLSQPTCSTSYTSGTPVASSPVLTSCSGGISDNYSFTYVAGSISISLAEITVTAPSFVREFGHALGTIPAPSFEGWVNGEYSSVLTRTPECTTEYSASSVVGSQPSVTCSGAAADNYRFVYIDKYVVVTRAPQTITFGTYNGMLAGDSRTVSATTTSGDAPVISYVSGDCSFDPSTGIAQANASLSSPPQDCVLEASVGSSTNFLAAGPTRLVIQVSNVALENQTIEARNITVTYGDDDPNADASASSGLELTFSSPDDDVVRINGGKLTIVGAGTATVTARQNGNSNFNPATPKTFTVTVRRAPLTISAPSTSVIYGDNKPGFVPGYSAFAYSESAQTALSSLPACDAVYAPTTTVASSPVEIECAGATAANYDITYRPGALTVNRAEVLVVGPNLTRVYGSALGDLSPSYEGWVNDEGPEALTSPTECTSAYSSSTEAGQTVAVTCSGAVASNYRFTYRAGSLTVTKATQTISVTDVTVTYGDPDFVPPVETSSGLATNLTSANGSRVSVAGNGRLNIRGVGDVTITVTQDGSNNYHAAPTQSFRVRVMPAPLLVRAPEIRVTEGDEFPTLTPEYRGFVRGENLSSLSNPAICRSTYVSGAAIGLRFDVICEGATSDNYDISYLAGFIQVSNARSNRSVPSTPSNQSTPPTVTPRAPQVVSPPRALPVTPVTPARSTPPAITPSANVPQNNRELAVPSAPVVLQAPSNQILTVDVGAGASAQRGPVSPISAALETRATRTPSQLRNEPLSGFSPGSSVVIQVSGARTTAQFVMTNAEQADTVAIAAALVESQERTASEFAAVTYATPVTDVDLSRAVTGTVTPEASELFEASGLGNPRTLGSFDIAESERWIDVGARADGYTAGTVVYLAVTTQPIIFGSAVVSEDGTVEFSGILPVDILESGPHNIRLVGTRDLGGVSIDDGGELRLSDRTTEEIQKFDQGTNAVVVVSGPSETGTHAAVRLVPLERDVPWWAFWVYLIAAIAGLFMRWRRPQAAWSFISLMATGVALSALPLVVAWVTFSYELILPTLAVLAVCALVLAVPLILRSRRLVRRKVVEHA